MTSQNFPASLINHTGCNWYYCYHLQVCKRGYIAMLAVDERHRKRKIGSTLVRRAIHAMQTQDADEVRSMAGIQTAEISPCQCRHLVPSKRASLDQIGN